MLTCKTEKEDEKFGETSKHVGETKDVEGAGETSVDVGETVDGEEETCSEFAKDTNLL